METPTVDFVVALLGNGVHEDIHATDDGFTARLVHPDTLAFDTLSDISKARKIGDVTLGADENDLMVTVHSAVDRVLLSQNDLARRTQRSKLYHMSLSGELNPAADELLDVCCQSLCRCVSSLRLSAPLLTHAP